MPELAFSNRMATPGQFTGAAGRFAAGTTPQVTNGTLGLPPLDRQVPLSSSMTTSSPIMADLAGSQCSESEAGNAFSLDRRPAADVHGEYHGEQTVRNLQDIIESGRAFSDLTNPTCIRTLCVMKVAGWHAARIAEEEVQVSQIMAGLTNQLFRVYLEPHTAPGILPRQVLFRVYGSNVGDLYDPAFELEVFKTLSEHESAPRMVAEFPGGRIEEYILGPALLMRDMMNPAVLCAMASILGKFHRLPHVVPKIASWNRGEAFVWKSLARWSQTAWTLLKVAQSTVQVAGDDGSESRRTSVESVGSTEELVRDKAKKLSPAAKQAMVDSLANTGVEEMVKEAAQLAKICLPEDAKPTVITEMTFCHNDVQENNVLVTGTRLRLIDFEYADFNYPAFDIANFFCESTINYCVSEYPYFTHIVDPARFPTEEYVQLFASVYLSEHSGRHVMPSDSERLRAFVEATYRFALASHLLWGFWSIVRAPQAATSSDFDFLLYAKSRFLAYRLWKDFLITKGLIKKE